MAFSIIAGIAAFSAAGGAAAGATAIALGAAAAAGTMLLESALAPDAPEQQPVQLGTTATPIDKSQGQEQADAAKLKVGEEEDVKKKRKKGKAAFKVELDKQDSGEEPAATGVQVDVPKETGVQL